MNYSFEPSILKSILEDISQTNAGRYDNGPLDLIYSDAAKLKSLSEKCLSGSYKFMPFEEKLILKGKDKFPRVISKPTFKDKAILKAIDKSLKAACPIDNTTQLASFIVNDVKDFLESSHEATQIMRIDIKSFFDNLDHEIIKNKLKAKNCPLWLLQLVESATSNPTKAKYAKKPQPSSIGVPQGISIASYLADLYMEEFDKELEKHCCKSFRYVDDILIFHTKEQTANLQKFINSEITPLGKLKIDYHREGSGKHFSGSLMGSNFDYLGYLFIPDDARVLISIKNSSVQKFINSLAGLITKYRKGEYDRLFVDVTKAKKAFTFDLNEKISGAFKEDKRYGWLWYFRNMNDLALLDKIDRIVQRELRKHSRTSDVKVKRLKRAFYEIQHFDVEKSKYIINYGSKNIQYIKSNFGVFDSTIADGASEDKIFKAYQHLGQRRLRRLMVDEVRES